MAKPRIILLCLSLVFVSAEVSAESLTALQKNVLNSRLTEAVIAGDIPLMKVLVRDGADANFRRTGGRTLIEDAVEHDNYRAFLELLTLGAKMDSSRPLFALAARKRNREMLAGILAAGYNYRAAVVDGEDLLCWAAREGHREGVEILLGMRMNPDEPCQGGDFPLRHAAHRGDVLIVRMLLDAGARPERGRSPALLAALRRGHRQIARLLLERHSSGDVYDESGSAVLAAVENDDAELLRLILAKRGNVNRRMNTGVSAIYRAAQLYIDGEIDDDTLGELLNAHPDLESADRDGQTPLMLAARRGNAALVQYLLEAGAKPDKGNSQGTASLHFAVYGASGKRALYQIKKTERPVDRAACVELLLAAGAKADKPGFHGRTALWWAAYLGRTQEAKRLLAAGADPNFRDKRGISVLDAAHEGGQTAMIGVLLRGPD